MGRVRVMSVVPVYQSESICPQRGATHNPLASAAKPQDYRVSAADASGVGYCRASMQTDPKAIYTCALDEATARLASLRRGLRVVVWLRITSLVLFAVSAGQACSQHSHAWGAPTAAALVFAALSVLIALLEARMARREAEAGYYQAGLARLEGRKAEGAPGGERFADPTHPYAVDLDLFGPASLFSVLCAARTAAGQGTLAGWLTQGSAVDEIQQRQQAVAELAGLLPLRRDLWLAGGLLGQQVREDALEAWLSAPAAAVSAGRRVAAAGLGLCGVAVLYAFAQPHYLGAAALVVLLQQWFARRYRPLVKAVASNVFRRAYELRVVARVAGRLERERFTSPRLAALQAGLSQDGRSSSQHVLHLVRLVDWFESRRNQLFGIVAWTLLLPEQLALAIEAWRGRHGTLAVRWLATIGEMEALASLATFAFEHPEYPFPELDASARPPSLVATGLGHPLIPAKVRVVNDVRLAEDCRLLVVTGSNMSGKSTLLRSVGVNVALAQAGGPVCAARMALSPLRIGASLRAQDSLEQGVSRFFAEIKRLHAILAMAGQSPPVLFLLDEILNGTNSHDRREGADAVVRKLLERGAIGLLTTHDLALSSLAEAPDIHGANIHFQDTIEGDRLIFDYKIRSGVVTRRNALDLMRMVGIEVPGSNASPG